MAFAQDIAKLKATLMLAFFNGAVTNTVVQIKGTGPAIVPYLRLLAVGATAGFVQLFAKPSASVTLGTTVPDWVVQLTASQDITIVNGLNDVPIMGILNLQGTGLSAAWTTTAGGAAAPATNLAIHAMYA